MNPKFESVKRGGYDMEQVDRYINHIRTEYNKIAGEYKKLYERVKVLESEKNDVAAAMTAAHTYERNRKQAADEQAEKIVAQAQAKAEKIIADAQRTTQAKTIATPTKPAVKPITEPVKRDYSAFDEEMKRIDQLLASVRAGGEMRDGTSNDSKIQNAGTGNQNAGATRRGVSDTNRFTARLSPVRANG